MVLVVIENFVDVGLRADEGEEHWQHHEAVEGTQNNDEEIHTEVVEFEKRGGGEGEDYDADELGEGDADEDGAAHFGEGSLGTLLARALLLHEIHSDMIAKLDPKP